jgi:hypothetical protein
MNCRPGDLAVIVRLLGSAPGAICFLGKLVTVDRVEQIDPVYGPYWRMAEPVVYRGVAFELIADAALRPIRDPGDDAIDWISRRTPRSVDLHEDQLTRARHDLLEATS